MQFEGIIIFMGNEETVGQNNTRKISFVIEEITDREFKQSLYVEQLGDKKVDMAKNLKVGDKVKVSLDAKSREYNGRYYNSISAWKIEPMEGGNASSEDLPF